MKATKVKAVVIYGVMIVLLCLTAVMLFRLDYDQWKAKEQSLSQVKLDSTAEALRIMLDLQADSRASFERHRQEQRQFMIDTLREYCTEDAYNGPRLFDDGAVVELRGNRVHWPEGVPDGYDILGAEDLRKGGQVKASVAATSDSTASDTEQKSFLFGSGRIDGDFYYVDWIGVDDTPWNPHSDSVDRDFFTNISQTYDGALLMISTEDASLPFIHESSAYPEAVNATDLGFTRDMIDRRSANVEIAGAPSMCVYSELSDGAAVLIHVKPLRDLFMRCLPHVILVEVSALIIIVTLCQYLLSVFRYVGSHKLTKNQMRRYHPKQLRRTVITAGLTGALIIFISSAAFQTLDALYEESVVGAKAFNRLFEQLQTATMDRLASEKQREADWRVAYGNQIAALIAQNPEAGRREKLQEYCDRAGLDYIMLFDSEGRETACNADYSGFTMDRGLGENSSDFRRLLLGVPSVVHDVSTDSVTGLTRQYIGVSLPTAAGSGNASHGALVMAIIPSQFRMNDEEITRRLHLIESRDILVCYAEPETGRILYANDASMPGKTVMEYGLSDKCLADGFTDFVTIKGVQSYLTTVRRPDVVFIYIIRSSMLFSNTLPASLASAIAYLLVLSVVIVICLRKYDESTLMECVGDAEEVTGDEGGPAAQGAAEPDEGTSHGLAELVVGKDRKKIPKQDRTPESRVRSTLKLDIILLILLPALFGLKDCGASVGNGTLLQFLLYGDWSRGLNLFALCSIIIILITGVVLVLLSNAILSLIAGFTGKGGETFCRLLYSLVNYIVVLGFLYYLFDYVGLPISTYIASLSVVSLALSLGAKDMVSDILAGLLIVFEGQFQVGDIVEIDGVEGEVLEIGVRSTRLLNLQNDIQYFTNSTIRNIVNKSKRDSTHSMELTFLSQASIGEIEALFKSALPGIGKRLNTIISGPRLGNVAILSNMNHSQNGKLYRVTILTVCKAADFGSVGEFVKREVYLFCERENIMLWEME